MIVDIKEIFAKCQFFIASRLCSSVRSLHANLVHRALLPQYAPVQDSQNSRKFGNLEHAAYGGATHEI